MKTYVKHCPTCSKVIRGRTDKKYCDDYCRNTYNNSVNNSTTSLMRSINSILRRNRRLLEMQVPDGELKVRIRKKELVEQGFDFRYFTNQEDTYPNRTLYFCYEYGYMVFRGGWVMIVKKHTPYGRSE